MSEAKPKLVAVGSSEDSGAAQREPQRERRWTDLGLGFWLLAVILAVAVAIIAVQARQAKHLVGQVQNLEVELGAANAAIDAYEGRFGEIQTRVGELRQQLGELEALVERPPTADR